MRKPCQGDLAQHDICLRHLLNMRQTVAFPQSLYDTTVRFLSQESAQFPHSLQNHVENPPTSKVNLSSIIGNPESDANVGLEARSERRYYSVCYHFQSTQQKSNINIPQINGSNRCRKKHSKSFMHRQPFSLRIYGYSSSTSSQERR